ncbi:peroxidase-related enzyme [Brachybacterium sp. DNPG3]
MSSSSALAPSSAAPFLAVLGDLSGTGPLLAQPADETAEATETTGIAGTARLAALIAALRPGTAARTRDAWAALYAEGQALPAAFLHSVAADVAAAQGNDPLRAWHAERSAADAPAVDTADDTTVPFGDAASPSLDAQAVEALRAHALLLAVSPSLAHGEDVDALRDAGASVTQIVLIAQLVAFESYLHRLALTILAVAGLALPIASGPVPATIGRGRQHADHATTPQTRLGTPRPTAYTREQLQWEPWVAVPAAEELTAEQVVSFAAKSTTNSVYFRLISLTPALTAARSDIDNAIFLPRTGGLPKAERELAAAATSKVNDCIYCCSVHARKAAALAKRPEDVDRLLAISLERDGDWIAADVAPLAAGQDARWSGIVRLAAEISRPRPQAPAEVLEDLRAQGLADDELLDALSAAAFFAWANRLMLTLGEPALAADAA